MYYKLSGITQRLTGSPPSTAYIPQGLKPAPRAPQHHDLRHPNQAGVRVWIHGGVPGLQQSLRAAEALPDGGRHARAPEAGVPDKLLYRSTMALTVGGVVYCLVALYIASQPRK